MTKREPPQAGTVDLAAPVTTDAPCRKCGYNLRGLSTSLRCPECNTPVLLSIHGDYLGFSDPRWLRSLRRGINLIIGAVSLIIGAFVMTLVVKFLAPQQGLESIVFAAALLIGCLMILIGNWLITSPDPSGLGEDEYGMERKVARIGITVWMCGAVVSVASLMGALPAAAKPVIDILSICLVLIALVAFCAQIQYLGKLAMRIPSAAVADRASFLKSAFAISYGLLFVIWVLMRLMGAAPQRNPEMMAVSCGAGMLGLLWGLMYLLMLEKLGRLLHPLALAAEQIWWAANETAESRSKTVHRRDTASAEEWVSFLLSSLRPPRLGGDQISEQTLPTEMNNRSAEADPTGIVFSAFSASRRRYKALPDRARAVDPLKRTLSDRVVCARRSKSSSSPIAELDGGCGRVRIVKMVTITFEDRETERKALAFLLGRFSGQVLKGGEHLVPEAALEALAEQNIPFRVKGKASYEQQVAAIRGAAPTPIQRRPRRSRRVAG